MKTKINKEYLEKIQKLADEFARERAKLFLLESYDKVYKSAYEVYYSIGVFLYIRLYSISRNPNDFNFNRIYSGLLKKFSCKLYYKILKDLEANKIIRINNHYNWVKKRFGKEQKVFTKSFMLTSETIRMINQAKARLVPDEEIYVPEKVIRIIQKAEDRKDNNEATLRPVQKENNNRLNTNLMEGSQVLQSTVNFYPELEYDENSLKEFCKDDDIQEHFLRKDLNKLHLQPKFTKGRWYHVFHSFSKKFREKVLRLDGEKIKEIFDVSACDLHMLAKILEEQNIPVKELKKFQLDVMEDFRKKFGTKKNGRCSAKVKTAFKVYLNSRESFYWMIRSNSICGRIDEYFKQNFPSIREYIMHKDQLWLETMEKEFEYISGRLVNELWKRHGIKALTCHDSVWVKESDKVENIKKEFYDVLGLAVWNEMKLESL